MVDFLILILIYIASHIVGLYPQYCIFELILCFIGVNWAALISAKLTKNPVLSYFWMISIYYSVLIYIIWIGLQDIMKYKFG